MRNRIITVLILSLLCGCKANSINNMEEVLSVDFEKILRIDVNGGELIPLETTDLSLLSSIDKVIPFDNKFIVQSRKKIAVFDSQGRHLYNIGNTGRAENEYLSVKSLYLKQTDLFIYDWQARKILNYDLNGDFQNIVAIKDTNSNSLFPSNIFPFSDGKYIVKNTYRGENNPIPEFSLLDSTFNHIHNFTGLIMKNGADRYDLTVGTSSTLLYNDFFGNLLYRIAPSNVDAEKAYYVDFGVHTLSEAMKEGKDYVDIIQESNSPEFINNIATLIRYCYETPETVNFIFAFRKGVHYCQYDKSTKTVKTMLFEDPSEKLKPEMFISYQKDCVYIIATKTNDISSNPVVIKLNNELFERIYE